MDAFYAFESVSARVIDINPDNPLPSHSSHLIVFFKIMLNCREKDI